MIDKSTISFNIGFLRDSALDLAQSQKYDIKNKGHVLVKPELEEANTHLKEAYRVLANMAKNNQEIMPAAEWLIDNFYIVQEQIVQVENDFPREYQRSIPMLTEGYLKGWPRVYELVLNLVTYTDNLVDIETLTHYIKSFQEERTLMLGEVWAIPIMARFVLIQQLAEKSKKVLQQKKLQLEVNTLIKEISEKDTREPGSVTQILTKWYNSKRDQHDELVLLVELTNQFQSAGMLQNEQKRWFAYRFNQFDISSEEALRVEAQKTSRLQVSIQNAVVSLREVAETTWSDFVEDCSIVDQMLRLDPLGYYAEMDSQTRDSYRRVIERLSRNSTYTETEVTEKALALAEEHTGSEFSPDPDYLNNRSILKQHIGYYLLDDGYEQLAKSLHYKAPFSEKLRRNLEKNSGFYIGSVAVLTVLFITLMWLIVDLDQYSDLTKALSLLTVFFPFLDLSVAATNRFFAIFLPPRILPKMQFKEKIPKESRTVVVVPTLLTSESDVVDQLEKLEIRALANPNPALQFALLSDFADADSETTEKDDLILKQIEQSITDLNQRYCSEYGDKFFVLHRRRLWNESEDKWMGWERKRGKIEEFNRLLCNPEAETTYEFIAGNFKKSLEKQPVKFVITLDADTQLPPESAVNLIRTASHPLNRAWFNPYLKRITKGYGIIQPRISIAPESAVKTWFSRIFSGNVGLDPYSTAVSDIYQDLNGEAVFTGKGIFDVQAFHQVMENRLPENHILSHDLIESTYIRTGLATDLELFDDYPATYMSYSKRNHRWTRGDWQIMPWLFSTVPELSGRASNPINSLSKWKIFDNLRRSVSPFFITLFFLGGWFWLPGAAWAWTLAGIGIIAFPVYTSLSTDLANRPGRVKWRLYMEKVLNNLEINSMQLISTLITLPHQAAVHLDAIFRTLWRMYYSKEKMLEWVTASQTEKTAPNSPQSYFRHTFVAVLLSMGMITASVISNRSQFWMLIPFSLLWLMTPYYAWYISQPLKLRRKKISEKNAFLLRLYARRTWFYFERFMNEEHNWLPPDNYQEEPPLEVAARTSPTNIGLALVSTVVAYNRGYITFGEMLTRLENTFRSLENLERYKGHFYNWYQTTNLEILYPRYISTVDSGNLIAGFIVIEEAIKKELNAGRFNRNILPGLEDTLYSIKEIFDELKQNKVELSVADAALIKDKTESMLGLIKSHEGETADDNIRILQQILPDAKELESAELDSIEDSLGSKKTAHLRFWLQRPRLLIERGIDEFKLLKGNEDTTAETGTIYTSNRLKKWQEQAVYLFEQCQNYFRETDFSFLYLKKRSLFTIGFNVDKSQADKSTYDLLASEARIASYIAIAKGEIPAEHWFRLSRRLTSLDKNEILLSWGGTMFEYLMPLLFMKTYPNTLLDHTYSSIIHWQRNYGLSRKYPWGFSESAYNFLNMELQYQYRAFGAPGLGLKRGLAEDYVVAPYASMLALMVEPDISVENLLDIEKVGGKGIMGFYDAIDFTPSHLSSKEKLKVVKTYMVHHHGMSLIAIENALSDWLIHDYFHSNQQIRSCDLLLQEKIPRGVPIKEPHPIDVELEPGEQSTSEYIIDHAALHELDVSPPRGLLLSNGSYSTFINHAGSGWSSFNDLLLTGKYSDPATDPLGFFIYLKDIEDGTYWSATHQPVKRKPDRYDTWFHNGKVITSRVDNWIETTTAVCVSPDYPMEYRKVTLTNYSNRKRYIQLTSYAEVVLNDFRGHRSHPAFSKLFIQTEFLAEHNALLAKRRPRSEKEDEVWMLHSISGVDHHKLVEPIQFETDRALFIGRGRNLECPKAMEDGSQLNGSLGNVLDPVMSLRNVLVLEPGEDVDITFAIGKADSYEEAARLAGMYDTGSAIDRVFDLATVYSSVEMNHIGINSQDAHYFQKLASFLIYPDAEYRASAEVLKRNRKRQDGLWPYGISGDFPLVVLRIDRIEQVRTLKKLLKAHAFWRFKGLKVEMLILNDHPPSYADEVQETINQEIQSSLEGHILNQAGGVFVQKSSKIPEEDLTLILSYAHLVLEGKLPVLGEKFFPNTTSWLRTENEENGMAEALEEKKAIQPEASVAEPEKELLMFNGYGGFNKEGNEYHIIIKPDDKGELQFPPAPWVNVIANPGFGFLATEKGAGYTWSLNSRENKLTSWSNDPVVDEHAEAFYFRDEKTKKCWSPAPGPVPSKNSTYTTRHGFGYTRYQHHSNDLEQNLTQFVHRDKPIKISLLTIKNTGVEDKELIFARYQDLVMGVERETSVRHIVVDADKNFNAIFAQNHYNAEFAGRVAFASLQIDGAEETETSFTTDRATFIGRNNSLAHPSALRSSANLNNEINIGGDICAAFKSCFRIQKGEEINIIVLTGETEDRDQAEALIREYGNASAAKAELNAVKEFWQKKLSRIQVQTPDESMNIMLNGWLMYQNISSRQFARSAFYQAGGAYGFRDQLQDSMAYLYADPQMTRKQILLHAEKQFKEGDVLHWWHPPTGRGIRSRITDDRLWLPYVTHFYIESTGDKSILDEKLSYITARTLEEHEHEVYLIPEVLHEKESLYEHCCRAIDISLQFGQHGIPLIGAGDWNDGMNRVGKDGKGESVWLGFFLYTVLKNFMEICRQREDLSRAARYSNEAEKLRKHLNEEGWDGDWYLRAFYDDGSPLGSHQNDECRIDAISQAWSVITGVANEAERTKQVLQSLDEHLIVEPDRIIKLLTPAFDKTEKNPGYIKGYIPGVRENGGQYTHGALWVVKAFAEAGFGDRAFELFRMVNPVNHGADFDSVQEYKVEPYVIAADVYGEDPLTGRGGWTWYTGSAGWMYRVGLESILGLRLTEDGIRLKPVIPSEWNGFSLKIMADENTEYHIYIQREERIISGHKAEHEDVNFNEEEGAFYISFKNDGKNHKVTVPFYETTEIENEL